eukprot:SAG11_NODE_11696_length_743_cov_1.492236_2_plen_68_part_01
MEDVTGQELIRMSEKQLRRILRGLGQSVEDAAPKVLWSRDNPRAQSDTLVGDDASVISSDSATSLSSA